jgi:apolipoprotein D and lipocalin family protein
VTPLIIGNGGVWYFIMKKWIFFILMLLFSCVRIPDDISPVTDFDIERYLGTWYEIARLDHSFERGLEKITAHYIIRDDGGINVVNRGFNPKKKKWKEAVGKAYFVNDPKIGRLKVSFWGPFYGGYNIIELDKNEYSYSVICGPDKSYLWILYRKPEMEEHIKTDLVNKAKSLGFETDKLIFVKHE